jgi:phosphoglycerol transferase MdoB-like AlkP superfamily enzyme
MREFGKFEKLPNLGLQLADVGYHCNFYFSGDLEFANTGAYLRASGFEKILDRDARPWVKTTPWGAMDEEILTCHLREAGKDASPFFSMIMTTTNHEPFDWQVTQRYPGNTEDKRYMNTSAYTDSCVLAYVQQAQQQAWWDNTIIIITSDHAHYWPGNFAKNEPERHHIPFLILGGALKNEYRGATREVVMSQTDFPAFLLSQLGLPVSSFKYSADPVCDSVPHRAFYTFDNGFGMLNDSAWIVFDHDLNSVVLRSASCSETHGNRLLQEGKACLQVMYGDYLQLY